MERERRASLMFRMAKPVLFSGRYNIYNIHVCHTVLLVFIFTSVTLHYLLHDICEGEECKTDKFVFNQALFLFSWCWVFICHRRCDDVMKALSQYLHWKGFSPVCVLSCAWRVPYCVNPFGQYRHRYGLSPVCLYIWVWRLRYCVNDLGHNLHLYGLSSLWINRWRWRWP